MRQVFIRSLALMLGLQWGAAAEAAAQAPAAGSPSVQSLQEEVERLRKDLEAVRQEYAARLEALEARLKAAEAGAPAPSPAPSPGPETGAPPEAPAAGAAGVGGATQALPVYGSPTAAGKVFNPDIGLIGNFIGAVGTSRGGSDAVAPQPFVSLQESEASFQAIVDPYAQADFFLAFGEEGVEVEEGYVTFPTVPGGLLVKVGKMRASFGKLNSFHNHSLPWADRPLVMFNLLGGSPSDPDTGIKDAGISLSRLLPAGKLFVEATGEIFRGDSGTLFQAARRGDFSLVGRLRAYTDLTDQTNLEAGVSYARGHNDAGEGLLTRLYGVDVTLRWRPLRRAIYRSFAARTEVVWSRREEPGETRRALGWFVSADYRLARRWFLGARYDWSERGREAGVRDRGPSAVVTFWPSEFSQIRAQYRRTRYGERPPANEVFLQTLFTIGTHGAHPF